MTEDQAVVELQNIDWASMDLEEAKQSAKGFMAKWDWQKKVPEYCRAVDNKTSVKAIAVFMWNATMRGLEIKQKAELGNLRYD